MFFRTGFIGRQFVAGSVGGPKDTTLDLSFMGTLDGRITFTRASTATYFDSTGTMQTAGTNVPRFDTDPSTLFPRGLLIEEVRTNLLLNSATLSTQSVTTTAQAYTLSFYGTGSITRSGTSSGTVNSAGAYPARAVSTFTPTAGTLTLTVTGSVTNAQLEAGAFATSYIPTTSAAVTRQADAATMPTGAWYSPAATSFVLEAARTTSIASGTYPVWFQFDDGTNNNRLTLYSDDGNQLAHITQFVANAQSFDTVLGSFASGTTKLGLAASVAGYSSTVNGGVPVTGPDSNFPGAALNRLYFINSLNGWLRRLRYWPRALSNTELQAATR